MTWTKSSHCDTSACVEVDRPSLKRSPAMSWLKSSFSNLSSCVEATWRKSTFSHQFGDCVEVGWQKSSRSSANECVEVGMWKKSTRSGPWTDNCVEVAGTEKREVLVRDSKDKGEGPILRFTEAEWKAFLAGVRDGEFDLADTP